MLRGIIFDLDGTLVDSRLDFERLRSQLDLPPQTPILEAIEQMPSDRAAACRRQLAAHEREGAEQATPVPGAIEFLHLVVERALPMAILTRNSRAMALHMLRQLPFEFTPILSRDDGPVKPDAWGVTETCQRWGISTSEVAVLGDYHFDIDAGRAAGAQTVLLHRHRRDGDEQWLHRADRVCRDFGEAAEWLRQI